MLFLVSRSVFFMNSQTVGDNITSEQQAQQLVSQIRFSGLTPLGTVRAPLLVFFTQARGGVK